MGSERSVSKKVIVLIVVMSILLIFILVVAFFMFFRKQNNSDILELDTGTIIMTYTDDSNIYSVTDLVPIKDTEGVKLDKYYDFSVSTTFAEAKTIDYEVAITIDEKNSTIDSNDMHIYLEKQKSGTYIKELGPTLIELSDKKSDLGAPKNSFSLVKVTKETDAVDNYRLRMWLSEDAEVSDLKSKTFAVKIEIFGKAN